MPFSEKPLSRMPVAGESIEHYWPWFAQWCPATVLGYGPSGLPMRRVDGRWRLKDQTTLSRAHPGGNCMLYYEDHFGCHCAAIPVNREFKAVTGQLKLFAEVSA